VYSERVLADIFIQTVESHEVSIAHKVGIAEPVRMDIAPVAPNREIDTRWRCVSVGAARVGPVATHYHGRLADGMRPTQLW
jgi:hypothetical protein